MIEAQVQFVNKPLMEINHLADAQQKALEQNVSVIQVLEEKGGYTPDELMQQLLVLGR